MDDDKTSSSLMAAEDEFPPITGQDIINCSFSSWYTKYHRLSPRARIIKPLPEEFIAFLKSDGIVIPGG
jgi:D123